MVQGNAVLFKPSNGLTCPWYFHCLIINERKTARESPPVDHLPLNKAAHVSASTFSALSLLLSFCNLILTQLYYYSVSLWVTFPLIGIWLFSVSLLILFQWTCLKRTHFLLRLCVIHASHFCNAWLTSSGGEGEPGIFTLCIYLLEFPSWIVKTQTRWQERWAACPVCQKCGEEAALHWVYSKALGWSDEESWWILKTVFCLYCVFIFSFFSLPLLIFKCIHWLLVLLLTFLFVSSTAQALPSEMVLASWGMFQLPMHSSCPQILIWATWLIAH